MGKKGTKKINRRVKRSARKTVGVLTLIMAIIVAAIPTPSARAVEGEETTTTVPAISYPELPDDSTITSYTKPAGAAEYDAIMIYRNSSGTYEMWNAYRFYTTTIGGSSNTGVIFKYNEVFTPQNGTLTIKNEVVCRYPQFTEQDINTFFEETSATGLRPLDDDELALYYKTEWDKYQSDLNSYNTWKRQHDAWLSGGSQGVEPLPIQTEPEELVRYAYQLTWPNKLRYFCDHEDSLGNIHGQGYQLQEVVDKTVTPTGGPIGSVVTYIPFNSEKVERDDISSGFYTPLANKFDVRYIGDGAFAGATNIERLVIPEEILQIGNGAFEGATRLEEITAYSGKIGNRAFKNCASLQNVTLGGGIQVIGTESFSGCNRLQKIEFPATIERIGKGAFAFDAGLREINMEGVNTALQIDEFAFYDCYALSDVKFCDLTSSIGKAAFAAESGLSGSWVNVTLPSQVTTLGDYVMSGRSNLRSIVMPTNYGLANNVTLGDGFFRGCINLQFVEFPDTGTGSCGYVSFSKQAFADVLTKDFYIRGPENNGMGRPASPRTSSWAAGITYVYKDADENDHWEVGSGIYRFTVDDNGILTSCVLISEEAKSDFSDDSEDGNNGEVVIPQKIGEIQITGIGAECFGITTDDYIYHHLKTLRIQDGSAIKSIDNNAFANFPALSTVYIGNSINSIGDSAFAGCSELETVVFSKPSGGYTGFTIGPNAFSTGSRELTFYGDIVEGYAPFEWAMSEENWMNEQSRLRVCYCSGTPDYPNLKLLFDNNTKLVTLVGYPHYDQLDQEIRTRYERRLAGIQDPSETQLDADQERRLQNVLNIIIPSGVESIDVYGFLHSQGMNDNNATTYMLNDPYYGSYYADGLFNGYYGTNGTGSDRREWGDDSAFETNPKGNDVILTVTMNSVKSLPERAFESCERLQGVSLGDAMEDIGTAPFTGCTNLTSVGGNNNYPCENGIIYEKNETGLTIIECLSARGSRVGQSQVNAENDDPFLSQVTQINEGAFENCSYVKGVDFTAAQKLTQIPKNCFAGAGGLVNVVLPDSVTVIREEAFADTGDYTVVTIPAVEVTIADSAFDVEDNVVILRSYKNSAVERYAIRRGHEFEVIDKTYSVQFWDSNGDLIPIVDEDGTEIYVQYVAQGGNAIAPEPPAGRDGYVFDKWDKPYTKVTSDLIVLALYKWGYPDTSPGVLPNTSPGAGNNGNNNGTPTPTPNGTPTPGAGTPGAGTPGAGTPGAGTPGASTPGASNSNQNSNQRYQLTVQNGSGSGTYVAGTTVVITADAPPSGQRFDRWTSIANDFNITSATSSITTITMPSHDMTIVANYTSGSGSSNGNNGNSANISSNTNGNGNSGGTTVDITKPGISDTNVASATVEGSTDNYVVKITDTAEARAAVEAALINEYGTLDNLRYFAMDISLYDSTGTVKITDTSDLAVNITMPIPDELRLYAGNNQVAGVVNGNVLDKLSPRFTTINGIPCISFTATHFSPYTVYVDTSNLSAGVSDSTPKTGDMIHPKWFLAVALACISFILLLKKDKKQANVKAA